MRLLSTSALLCTTLLACVASASASTRLHRNIKRDAYTTFTSGDTNTEGEAHGDISPPKGAVFISVPVGKGGEEIAAYWSANAANKSATHAYIMIHGKLRDGDTYWSTMDGILTSALQDNVAGVSNNSIIVAPQFFSTVLNSGQYTLDQLAWGDINAWQAGSVATHPSSTTLTSFDALDAIVAQLANQSTYPSLTNITVIGHGGGGQLNQRYSMLAQDAPSNVHVRYIHGDPSSCAYFTEDRPQSVSDSAPLPSISSCNLYNTWRYGFDNFTGTAQGLKTPQQYFTNYITRDIISIVGYQDVQVNGDTTCMGQIQGGSKRRDRNLSWWQYVNTLARTNEDLTGFPATYGTLPDWSNISSNAINLQLIVVEDADHDAGKVFGSDVGRASLFATGKMPTGWRPTGWTNSTSAATSPSSSSSAKASVKSSAAQGSSLSSSSSLIAPRLALLLLLVAFSSYCLM